MGASISRGEMQKLAQGYEGPVHIGVLGSHSGEEVGMAAKSAGFKTVVVCERGRDTLYTKYNRHLFDEVLLLDSFKDMAKPENGKKLQVLNAIFIPNRSFSVYLGYDAVEKEFPVPLYGARFMLRVEDRNIEKNQYWLLKKAGIRMPRIFSKPSEIDRLTIVKVQQKNNPLERAFFYVQSEQDYLTQSKELIKNNVISQEGLYKAVLEEFVLGPRFNANFQKNALGGIDFVGFEDRIQINIGGLLNLPAAEQAKLHTPIKNEEVGHFGVTMRESMKPLVYQAAEKFVEAAATEFAPGIIGLFSLQGALAYNEKGKVEFVVFDVSPRIPGCPCVGPTSPEMRRLSLKYGQPVETPLDLCMLEIRKAIEQKKLGEIVT